MSVNSTQPFSDICRQWRQCRKLSQLDLALAANISQRHLSWLLKRDALASGNPDSQERIAGYLKLAEPVDLHASVTDSLLPVLPLELKIDDLELSLFSVISTFGTPQDVTTDELRIETFYPTNAITEQFFRNTGGETDWEA